MATSSADMSPAAMPAAAMPSVTARASRSAPASAKPAVLFSGVPAFVSGQAVLFDSAGGSDPLPETGTLTRLEIRFPAGAPEPGSLDPGLSLLIFVDDLSQPRARVRVAHLVRQGGERPLNISRRSGERVQVVLVDPSGAWASGAPPIEVALG
jgi:Ca-activated chloride channel family protein